MNETQIIGILALSNLLIALISEDARLNIIAAMILYGIAFFRFS